MEALRELKDREKRILKFMKEYIQENHYPPTVREVCAALSIKSTSTVHKDIANLEKAGYITKDHTKSRALIIANIDEEPQNNISSNSDSLSQNSSEVEVRHDVVDIPVIGHIAAGTPILAEENIDDAFPIPSRFVSSGNNFMLVVKGESMIEAGIMDGDYILAQQTNTASNGDIVIAMIDGEFEPEATVKTFFKENGHIRLQPENSTMKPIIVPDCQILGKVKGVFRYF